MFGSPEVGTTSDRPQPRRVTAKLPWPHKETNPNLLPLGATFADFAELPDLEAVPDQPERPPRSELSTQLPGIDPQPRGAATRLSQSEPRLRTAPAPPGPPPGPPPPLRPRGRFGIRRPRSPPPSLKRLLHLRLLRQAQRYPLCLHLHHRLCHPQRPVHIPVNLWSPQL